LRYQALPKIIALLSIQPNTGTNSCLEQAMNSQNVQKRHGCICNRSGMALLNVIMLLILIGAMVIAGYKMMGPIIQRGKINDTKTIIKSDVDAIFSWTVTNCRIPDAGTSNSPPTDFNHVVQNPNDAWGNPLAYLYAPELASATSCAGICGLNGTSLTVDTLTNVAFLILSSQYSGQFHYNLPSSSLVTVSTGVSGTVSQTANPDPPDISRIITLNELKSRIGCVGYTQGQLRILNNELPSACAGSSSYAAQLHASAVTTTNPWSLPVKPSWLTVNPINGTISVAPASSIPTSTGTHQIIAQLTDFSGASVQRSYNLQIVSCNSGGPGTIIPGTDPDPPVQPPINPGFDTSDPTLIEFGLDNNNSSACVWYPQNLPLSGKTMRAYWSFCYRANDTSATSTTYADGYTFTLMQASNPTSYCGTGSIYNAITNPRYDCSGWGGLGEYLAYCGLPGYSTALEFDIFPNGGRNDPTGSYNHIAIVNGFNHASGSPTGIFGDNTHNKAPNPACTTSSSGCLYDNMTGHTYPVTWLENTGCNATFDNHNARVELHTRCNNDCSQCETNSCTTKALIKLWVDRGNSNLDANDATTPDMSYCTDLPTALNQYKVGFTEATGGAHQWGYIKNFSLKSLGTCPLAAISPDTLPTGTVGVPYSSTMSASGGTPPYSNWGWSSSAIPGVTASNLPPGLTISTAGVISGTPTTAGTYNTVLVSVNDACTADTCTNTVSKSYTITIATPPAPTCTLTANPTSIAYGGTTSFIWTIANGPANGTWSIAPGGTCSNFINSNGGTCTSGSLTTSGTTIYNLTVSNAGGSTACSTSVKVGCGSYRVWNNTGIRYDFYVAGSCRNNINNGSEITNSTTVQLSSGDTLSRDSSTGSCNPSSPLGSISFTQANNADSNGDCQVNYDAGDTVSDR
jgi:hypothetical protein